MNIHRSVIFSILFLLFGCNNNKYEDTSKGTDLQPFKNTQEISKFLSQELLQEYQRGTFEGSILITHKDSVLLKESYGWADRKEKLKNSSTSISDIGSIIFSLMCQ